MKTFFLLACAALICVCAGKYVVEVKLKRFEVPKGQAENGRCCDAALRRNCECRFFCPKYLRCDLKFNICVEGGASQGTDCSTDWRSTGVVARNADVVEFGEDADYEEWENPHSFTFDGAWSILNGVRIRIEAYDEDGFLNKDDYVDTIRMDLKDTEVTLNQWNSVSQEGGKRKAETKTHVSLEYKVRCADGYLEPNCQNLASINCNEVAKKNPSATGLKLTKLRVYGKPDIYEAVCNINKLDGGIVEAWTYIMNRQTGMESFDRDYADYEKGFGDPTKDHWVGLEKIYSMLTTNYEQRLRIVLTDCEGNTKTMEYKTFKLIRSTDSTTGNNMYQLKLGEPAANSDHVTAGDSMASSEWGSRMNVNNRFFTARDRDYDGSIVTNCARGGNGGWWYNYCGASRLTGKFTTDCTNWIHGPLWLSYYRDSDGNADITRTVKKVTMMISERMI